MGVGGGRGWEEVVGGGGGEKGVEGLVLARVGLRYRAILKVVVLL